MGKLVHNVRLGITVPVGRPRQRIVRLDTQILPLVRGRLHRVTATANLVRGRAVRLMGLCLQTAVP